MYFMLMYLTLSFNGCSIIFITFLWQFSLITSPQLYSNSCCYCFYPNYFILYHSIYWCSHILTLSCDGIMIPPYNITTPPYLITPLSYKPCLLSASFLYPFSFSFQMLMSAIMVSDYYLLDFRYILNIVYVMLLLNSNKQLSTKEYTNTVYVKLVLV